MLRNFRKQIDRKKADYHHAQRQVEEETQVLKDAVEHLQAVQEAQLLVQSVAKAIQASAHQQITSIVTRCLEAVFGEGSYSFRIDWKEARGKTEARLLLERDGETVDPLDAAGGGVVDVCSFSLRLAALLLSRPAKRRLLVLDEPWKHLSREFRPRVRAMLEALAEEFSVQFLIITHAAELACGRIIEIS